MSFLRRARLTDFEKLLGKGPSRISYHVMVVLNIHSWALETAGSCFLGHITQKLIIS